jgi:hypothetical protein
VLKGWRDIYFQSDDGTPLEGWYIPAKGGESDKLIIFNHALPMCRAGFPAAFPASVGGSGGTSMSAIYAPMSELQGVTQYQELIDLEWLKMGAFTAAEMTPHLSAPGVKMPVLMIQVLKDSWTKNPEDAQKTFVEKVLAFFDKHMK